MNMLSLHRELVIRVIAIVLIVDAILLFYIPNALPQVYLILALEVVVLLINIWFAFRQSTLKKKT